MARLHGKSSANNTIPGASVRKGYAKGRNRGVAEGLTRWSILGRNLALSWKEGGLD